jgi:glutathione peroxidase
MSDTATIYDIPLKSLDGEENFLSKFKGKVSMIVNVTADCGNAPQLATLEKIYQKYKDQGFEIVAVPTNDFCGPGITYNEYAENGISCGEDARDYALRNYNVSFEFSELVTSNPHESWREKRNNYGETHELYKTLTGDSNETMGGNFEKFLISRDGTFVKRFHNYTLLDYYHKNVKEGIVEPMENQAHPPLTSDEAFDLICSEIEKLL